MIYVIYGHGEYGAEDIIATSSAEKITKSFDEFIDLFSESVRSEAKEDFDQRITDNVPGKFLLCRGWGGPILHILEDGEFQEGHE